jgi:hypothetical protein
MVGSGQQILCSSGPSVGSSLRAAPSGGPSYPDRRAQTAAGTGTALSLGTARRRPAPSTAPPASTLRADQDFSIGIGSSGGRYRCRRSKVFPIFPVDSLWGTDRDEETLRVVRQGRLALTSASLTPCPGERSAPWIPSCRTSSASRRAAANPNPYPKQPKQLPPERRTAPSKRCRGQRLERRSLGRL